jgi:hypothetical protein
MQQSDADAATGMSPVELLRAGSIPHAERLLDRGEIVRVVRGIYAPANAWRRLAPWERYRARVHATAMRYPDSVFVLESAAVATAMPIFGEPAHVHVLRPPPSTARVVDGMRVHTSIAPTTVHLVGGLLVADAVDTVVGLARSRHPALALASADAAMRLDPTVTREVLAGTNELLASSRGRRTAEWVLARADPRAETPIESISRAAIEWLGFPMPELQQTFRHPRHGEDRVDTWWPDARVAGESDGDLKYDGRYGDAAALLRERRLRDARLLELGVRATAHWGWSDVVQATPLRAALQAAGLHPVRPAEPAPLFALRRLLTPGGPATDSPSARLQ